VWRGMKFCFNSIELSNESAIGIYEYNAEIADTQVRKQHHANDI